MRARVAGLVSLAITIVVVSSASAQLKPVPRPRPSPSDGESASPTGSMTAMPVPKPAGSGTASSAGAAPPSESSASATSTPIVLTVTGKRRLRVQLIEATQLPCESPSNKVVFNGAVSPGSDALNVSAEGSCVCERHKADDKPKSKWSDSKMVCRPRVCNKNHVCRPAPDATIRLSVN